MTRFGDWLYEGPMERYGEWLDEGLDRSEWLGMWRLIYSVSGFIIVGTAILYGLFVLFGWT